MDISFIAEYFFIEYCQDDLKDSYEKFDPLIPIILYVVPNNGLSASRTRLLRLTTNFTI